MTTDKVYSVDTETWYDSFEQALDVLRDTLGDGESLIGTPYREGEKQHRPASYYFRFAQVLEDMCECAMDDVGEAAEGFGEFRSLIDQAECQQRIKDALDDLLPVNFWAVRNPKRCEITPDDVECICPACNGSGEGRYEGTRCSSCNGSGTGEL